MAIKRPDFAGSVGSNILSDDDYELLNSYNKGFQPDNVIVSSYVNSLLREFSLLSGAVESYALNDPGFNLGINNTKKEWSDKFEEGINNKIINTTTNTLSLYKKSTIDVSTNDEVDNLYWGNPLNPETEKSIEITNARNATKLQTARSIQVDLASSNSDSFNGTRDAFPGVKGILPETKGGTGKSDLNEVIVGKAKKIYTDKGIGNQTTPVYVDSNGTIKECVAASISPVNSTYATKIGSDVSHPAIGNNSTPVYVDNDGSIKACTKSFNDYYDLEMSHIEGSYDGSTVTISSDELEKLTRLENQILFLKLNYTNSSTTKYDILKFNDRVQDSGYLTYTFANSTNTVEISLTGEMYNTLDEILMYGTTTSKATYADYAEYSIKNSNGSYSKFTHKQNGVLYVGDTHIVSKKKLLWSGNVNIGTSGVVDYVDIYTHSESLIGKKLEIWLYDDNGLFLEPITFKVRTLGDSAQIVKKNCLGTDSFDVKWIRNTILELRYNPTRNKIDGLCQQHINDLADFSTTINAYDCYVEEIYEVIE